MQTCPTCRAALKGRQICRRCKTDLTAIIAVEKAAQHHDELARRAFALQHFNRMYHHARRSHGLVQTQASAKLLAIAALLTQRYPQALALHDRIANSFDHADSLST